MTLSAVVFDLDYTLAVPERDRQSLLDSATAAAGVRDIDRQEYLAAHRADLASETRAPIFDALLDEGDPEAVARAYREAIDEALVPVEGAAEFVRELRRQYAVGVLTDGPLRAQWGKLEALGWTDLFDAVVVTGSLPAGKPDPRTFEAILDELGVSAREAAFVGDDPEADIRGADAAGFLTVQVLGEGIDRAPEADAYVDRATLVADLRELLCEQTHI